MTAPIKVFAVKGLGDGTFELPDGSIVKYGDLPVGAAWWVERWYRRGPDGKTLAVKVPGRVWMPDERASNCTRPNDNEHRCWVRHGSIEDGTLHVDKAGNTCAAGAGSIVVPGWHGFLHNGHLVKC